MTPAPASESWLGWRLFLPFAIGYFFSYVVRNANAVIAGDLTRDLGLSAADLGLLTGAYLGAFALAQLPLGVLLDRYGPRRVEAGLLGLAALGCLLFARGESLAALLGARALVGVGVSACLMASFASFALWYPPSRQPSLNGAVMVAGSIGALVATAPLAWLYDQFGWRAGFTLMAAIALLVAGLIWTTPERHPARPGGASLASQIAGVRLILRSRAFWIFAPQCIVVVGTFIALQGLWAIPFLTVADGHSSALAANRVAISAAGMLAGFAAVALTAGRLAARGIRLDHVLAGSYVIGACALCLIAAGLDPGGTAWFVLGACYGIANLAYALLQRHFDLALAGRANTALNLMAFAGAFAVQWLYGLTVDALGHWAASAATAHRMTLGCLAALQVLGCLRFLWALRRLPQPGV